MSVLLIFWDGVGVGRKDPRINPFFSARMETLRTLLDGEMVSLRRSRIHTRRASAVPVNATLGVAGLPQSGTGQTALFTGVNAAKVLGHHFGPYPHSAIRSFVLDGNIFHRLQRSGRRCRFANAYPRQFFEYLSSPRGKYPVVALASVSAGLPLNGYDRLKAGEAVSADIVADRWRDFGYADIEKEDAFKAGKRFYRMAETADFLMFEYFLTDKAGHSQSMEAAVQMLERMDRFIAGVLSKFDEEKHTLLIISDHGNIEDLSTKSHTRNPVPLIAVGKGRTHFARRIGKLTDLTPAVVDFLERG